MMKKSQTSRTPTDPGFSVTIPPSPTFNTDRPSSPESRAKFVEELFTRAPPSYHHDGGEGGPGPEDTGAVPTLEFNFKIGSTRSRMRRGAASGALSPPGSPPHPNMITTTTPSSKPVHHRDINLDAAASAAPAAVAATDNWQTMLENVQISSMQMHHSKPAVAGRGDRDDGAAHPSHKLQEPAPSSEQAAASRAGMAPAAAPVATAASESPATGSRFLSGIIGLLKRGGSSHAATAAAVAAAAQPHPESSTTTTAASAGGGKQHDHAAGVGTSAPALTPPTTTTTSRHTATSRLSHAVAALGESSFAEFPPFPAPRADSAPASPQGSTGSGGSRKSSCEGGGSGGAESSSGKGVHKLTPLLTSTIDNGGGGGGVMTTARSSPRPRSASSPEASAAAVAAATADVVASPAGSVSSRTAGAAGSAAQKFFADADATAAPGLAVPPSAVALMSTQREIEESSALAADGGADDAVAQLAESFVAMLSPVVLEAFEVSKEQLASTLCADARRKRRLRALLHLRRTSVMTHAASSVAATAGRCAGGGAAGPQPPVGGLVGSSAGGKPTGATGWEDDPAISKIDEEEGPAIICGKKLRVNDDGFRRLAREVAHLPAFLGLVLFQRAVEAALVDDAENALMMLSCVQLRRLLQPGAGAASGEAGTRGSIGHAVPPPLLRQLSHFLPLDGVAAAAAAASTPGSGTSGGSTGGGAAGESGGAVAATRMFHSRPSLTRSHSFGFNAPLGDERPASPRVAYVHGAPQPVGMGMADISLAVATLSGASAAPPSSAAAPLYHSLSAAAAAAPPVNVAAWRVAYPTSPEEAYIRRANDRVRAALRLKCLAGTISALDFLRVWSGALSDLPRTDRLIALLNPSPDPVVVHHGVDTRTEIRRAVRTTKRAAAAAGTTGGGGAGEQPPPPGVLASGIAGSRGPSANVSAPNLATAGASGGGGAGTASGFRRTLTSTNIPDVGGSGGGECGTHGALTTTAAAATGAGGFVFPPRHARSGSIIAPGSLGPAPSSAPGSKPPAAAGGPKGAGHSRFDSQGSIADAAAEAAATNLALDDTHMFEVVRLTRHALLELARKLSGEGVTSVHRVTRLVPGPDFPTLHRVQMEDLAPCVESLVERHPDLASYRDKPLPRARFLSGVMASIFSSLPQGLSLAGVPLMEVRASNLADSLWLCSTSSTVGMVPFSTRWNDRLQAEYETAACATRVADEREGEGGGAGTGRNGRRSDFGLPGTLTGGPSSMFSSLFGGGSSAPSGAPGAGGSAGLGAAGQQQRRDSLQGAASCSRAPLDINTPAASPSQNGAPGPSGMVTPRNHRAAGKKLRLPDPDPLADDKATVTLAAFKAQCDVNITSSMLERVFAGAPKPLMSGLKGRVSYEDFVWLACMQGERMAGASQEYWTRCLDLDDDGVLGPLDLACAAQAKHSQLICCGVRNVTTVRETMEIVMDAVIPHNPAVGITRRDVKRSGNGPLVYDMLVSLCVRQAGGKKELSFNPMAMGTHAM